MEKVCTMLSGGRIIRILIVLLACVAVWKVWDYIGGADTTTKLQPPQPVPSQAASKKVRVPTTDVKSGKHFEVIR